MKYWLFWFLIVAPGAFAENWEQRLVGAAREQTLHRVVYDGSYERIAYPMGDVARDRNLPHIGLVSSRRSADEKRPLIIHNIGAGLQEEDALYVAPITGHYRFSPPSS